MVRSGSVLGPVVTIFPGCTGSVVVGVIGTGARVGRLVTRRVVSASGTRCGRVVGVVGRSISGGGRRGGFGGIDSSRVCTRLGHEGTGGSTGWSRVDF